MSRLVENSTLLATVLLAINVLALNLLVLSKQYAPSQSVTAVAESIPAVVECDSDCQDTIASKITADATEISPKSIKTVSVSLPREWHIPLGIGQSSAKDWEQLAGVEATIDTRNYPTIKKATFEVYLSIPTANGFAFAKLYNVTQKHDVWLSEVSMETDVITKRETTIKLDPGLNTYRVMMKSTMGYEAKLHNARIKIVTE